jgi:hypothetical protein
MVWTLTVSDMDSGCPRVPLQALQRRHVACLYKACWTARTRALAELDVQRTHSFAIGQDSSGNGGFNAPLSTVRARDPHRCSGLFQA